jgi:hypothetical protein
MVALSQPFTNKLNPLAEDWKLLANNRNFFPVWFPPNSRLLFE